MTQSGQGPFLNELSVDRGSLSTPGGVYFWRPKQAGWSLLET